MMSVELSNRLSEMSGDRVEATIAFDYPSVRLLKSHFEAPKEEVAVALSFMSSNISKGGASPIVCGHACRFATAREGDSLLKLIWDGVENVGLVRNTRWKWEQNFGEGKSVSKWGGFVARLDLFDAVFFAVSPREAK